MANHSEKPDLTGLDAEKGDFKDTNSKASARISDVDGHGQASEQPGSKYEANKWTRLGVTADSFRRRPIVNQHNQLNETLKKRHLHMIAVGGSIGAGLFVGSGSALSRGGPATLLIDFALIGIMIFNVVYALGELSMMYPVSGGFYTLSSRFIDPAWGQAMGWNYVLQWAVVVPLELTVAGLTVGYWEAARDINIAVFITVFWVALCIISVFGVLGYAEEEFWSSILKLTTVIIFMIIGLVLVLGGGPSNGLYSEYWGARLWYDPGAFANGFKGFCSVFVTAAFSFSGTELVGLAASESANPTKTLPGAIKQVFWRITLFFLLALTFVGLLVPYDDPSLAGNNSLLDVSTSPFVIVADRAGLRGFNDYINVVILVSVISIGLSGVFGGSRCLCALAEQGYAPKVFTYIDRAGRPLPATIAILACGGLAYITLSSSGMTLFNWLLALSGLAALFTWGSICLTHIRFRHAWKDSGRTLDDLPFRSPFGETGSWLGLILIVLVLCAQFYVALFPIGGDPPNAESFFEAMLALPVVLVFWAGGWLWAWRQKGSMPSLLIPIKDLDITSGMREHNWDEIRATNARKAKWPLWRRMLDIVI